MLSSFAPRGLIVLFFVVVSAIATAQQTARQQEPCIVSLRAPLKKIAPALIESADGARLHQQLSTLIEQNRAYIDGLINSRDKWVTFGMVRIKVLQEVARTTKALKVLSANYKTDSIYFRMIKKALAGMAQDAECPDCKSDIDRPMNEIRNSHHPHDIVVQKYISNKDGLARSFVNEILTALETPGLIDTGVQVIGALPKKLSATLVQSFGPSEKLLLIDIDVLAHSSSGGFEWIEVKNPARRIKDISANVVTTILRKQQSINDLFAKISDSRELRGINLNIRFKFIIRGAGMTPEVQAYLRSQGVDAQNAADRDGEATITIENFGVGSGE